MSGKYEQESATQASLQQQTQQPEFTGEASATNQEALATLIQVFNTFQRHLQNELPRPFSDAAKAAVNTFNDIGAKLQFKFIPDPPDKLTIKSSAPTELELKWVDDTNNADGFKVWRCTGAKCQDFVKIRLLGPEARIFRDVNLSGGTTYRYKLSAFNFRGETSTGIVEATTKDKKN